MILLPIAALEIAKHGRDHPRQILVEVFRTQLHFLIFAELGNAVLNVNVGGAQRNQKRTTHAECSLASECNFLVDVTVGLFAGSGGVEDERVVRCRELVANPLVPILPSDQCFFVEPGLEAGAVESFEKPGRKRTIFAGVADENARTGTKRRRLCNNSAFSSQSVVEFGKEFADVGVLNLDARATLVEQYRPLSVAFRQTTQRLGGDAAGSAMQLKGAHEHFHQNAQVPLADSEADEEKALSAPPERPTQAVGERRTLGDDGDQEV